MHLRGWPRSLGAKRDIEAKHSCEREEERVRKAAASERFVQGQRIEIETSVLRKVHSPLAH